MIINLAVAQGVLAEYRRNEAEAEKRRQHEFARTGKIAVAPESLELIGKVAGFLQGMRPFRTEQAAPRGLAGDMAA